VLVLRGETSDLLLPETLERMRGAGAQVCIVPQTGHAPALMDPVQIAAIKTFLDVP